MYTYNELSDMEENKRYNTYGVIRYVKFNQNNITIGVVDPSITNDDKFICNLFFTGSIPYHAFEIGKIIRIHRLKIEQYNNKLIGVGLAGFSYLIFSEVISNDYIPLYSSSHCFTVEAIDNEIIKKLRLWILKSQPLIETMVCTLNQCVPGKYIDLKCQMLAKCQLDIPLVIYVWDGTLVNIASQIKSVNSSTHELSDIEQDKDLIQFIPSEYIVPIYIYDEHINECNKIPVGKYILLTNVHISIIKKLNMMDSPTSENLIDQQIEFVLHGGSRFNRGIKENCSDSQFIEFIQKRQAELSKESDEKKGAVNETEAMQAFFTEPSEMEAVGSLDVLCNLSPPKSQFLDVPPACQCGKLVGKVRRELHAIHGCKDLQLITAQPATSVLLKRMPNSQNLEISYLSIGDLKRATPGTYTVCAYAHDYSTRTGDVLSFLKVWCPACNFLSKCPRRTLPLSTPPSLLISRASPHTSTPKRGRTHSSSEGSSESTTQPPMLTQVRPLRNRKLILRPRASQNLKVTASTPKKNTMSHNENWLFNALPCQVIDDVGFFNCPQCRVHETCSQLQFVYAFKIGLAGCDGGIEALLMKDEGETFFQGLTPLDLLRDPAGFHTLRSSLDALFNLEDNFKKCSKNPKSPLEIPTFHCEINVVEWESPLQHHNRDYLIINTIMNP